MKYFLFILNLFLICPFIQSQSLDFKLDLNYEKIQSSNIERFQSMESEINNFILNREWTDFELKEYERVNINFLLEIVEQLPGNKYKANLEISATRPVYMSSYYSSLFKFKDDNIEFKYIQGDNFDFNENAFVNDLSSVCAYYINIILGLDADSFQLESGENYYRKAEKAYSNAQISGNSGWSQSEASFFSRHKLIFDLLNIKNKPFKSAFYNYHRKALDYMHKNTNLARKNILNALVELEKIAGDQTALVQIFYDTKIEELLNIFKEANEKEKEKLKLTIKKSSPARLRKLEEIF